jgi:hypothetical protein
MLNIATRGGTACTRVDAVSITRDIAMIPEPARIDFSWPMRLIAIRRIRMAAGSAGAIGGPHKANCRYRMGPIRVNKGPGVHRLKNGSSKSEADLESAGILVFQMA